MTNYTKKAIHGAATIFVVSVIAAFVGYLVRFLMARNLTVEDFGLFYSVFSFLSLFIFVKSLGLERSLIYFIPQFKHEKRYDDIKSSIVYVAIVQFITNTFVIIGIFLLSSYLSTHFFHSDKSVIVLKLMAIAFFIDNFVFILKFSFQGFQEMGMYSVIDLVRMLITLCIVYFGFRMNYGIISPVLAYIIAPAILIVIYTPILLKSTFPQFSHSKFSFDKPLMKKLLKNGIFVMSADLAWLMLGSTDNMLLTYFSGLAAVGLYNVAMPTANLLTYFPKAVAGIILPMSTELWTNNKKNLLKDGMELLYKYTCILIIPMVLLMLSFSELIISVLFGKEYLPAANAMKILSIGTTFAAFYMLNTVFLVGIGKIKLSGVIVYTGAFVNLVFNIFLIPHFDVIGAAIATSSSYFIMLVIGTVRIKKIIELKLPVAVWTKSLIAGIFMLVGVELLKKLIFLNVWTETAIVLFGSGIIYVTCLFVLKTIDIEEIKVLLKRVTKG